MQYAKDVPVKNWAANSAKAKANRMYPDRWYQNERMQQAILVLIGISVTLYQFHVGWGNTPRWFIVLGMGAFLAGWLADVLTTASAFRELPEYRKRGLVYPIVERNPFLPDYPSWQDQLLNLSSAIKMVTLLLTPLIPAVGWGAAWSGLSAALNNRRNAEGVRYQLEQYDLLVKNEKRYPRASRTQTGLTSMTGSHHNRILLS